MTMYRFNLLLCALVFGSFAAPDEAHAQVSGPYTNVLCVWNSGTSAYQVHVVEMPANVTTITQDFTGACSNDANDLLQAVKADLVQNTTWAGLNDQLGSHHDLFCPGPDHPTLITQLMASMSYHQSGKPQAGLVINHSCPSQTGGGTGGGTSVTPDQTYAYNMCAEGWSLVSVPHDDPFAVKMTTIGPSRASALDNTWAIELDGVRSVLSLVDLGNHVDHCDAAAASAAQDYMQANVGSLDPQDFGWDAWQCPEEDLVVTVTECKDNGTDSTYGYTVDCCPPVVPADAVWGGTSHGACVATPDDVPFHYGPLSLSSFTNQLAPATYTYTDPLTVCQQAEQDALQWFDANLPQGNPPCFQTFGAPIGSNYVPGTYHFTSCTVSPSQPGQNCGSGFYVQWRQEYACAL